MIWLYKKRRIEGENNRTMKSKKGADNHTKLGGYPTLTSKKVQV